MPEKQFYVLADGMGGHNAGEVAAKTAVTDLCKGIKEIRPEPSELKKIIYTANKKVYDLAAHRSDLHGMGTTLCCFWVFKKELLYAHVGDSRIYRYRDALKRLTQDHSLRQELLIKGELKEKDLSSYPHKNIITKAIGTTPYVEPDIGVDSIEKGDIYFLCSDGLTDMVTDIEIEEILKSENSIEKVCDELVSLAKSNGGSDNITIVMIRIS